MEDVIIIGGGICGCSLLYELSRYKIKALLLEKENDISLGTTKANSAIVHAGYDPEPHSKMALYNVKGNAIIQKLCKDLDVSFKQVGSLVIAFEEEQLKNLQALYEKGIKNGVPDLKLLSGEEAALIEPNLSKEVKAALYAPSAAVVSPWGLCIALAENAVLNGANVSLNSEVLSIEKQEDYFKIKTTDKEYKARYVINAAGINADEINDMAAEHSFKIYPSKGEYFLLDKNQGDLVSHIIFQCPGKNGKGVLVAPTVDGNIIVGPNALASEKDDLSTTTIGLNFVRSMAVKSIPKINFRESIRNFAGLRSYSDNEDFIVAESQTQKGFFNIAGIKSPGLTSAPAIALDIVDMLKASGLSLEEKEEHISTRRVTRFKELSNEQRKSAIEQNPLYGAVVCRCETITEGEIVDALHRPIPPHSIDGIKRRCGAGMGRCQGGFCSPKVQQIIARELNIPQEEVLLDRVGTYIITGRTKG